MKVEIKPADNGYILTIDYEDPESENSITVFACGGDVSSTQCFKELLNELDLVLGPSSSRYDDERIYTIIAPGDKHESFTEAHSKVIWGDNDK